MRISGRWILLLMLLTGAVLRATEITPSLDDPGCTDTDRKFMRRAMELVAWSINRDLSPFSAVLVKDGKIIAEYVNTSLITKDVTEHAETGLIRAFSPAIDRATFAQSTLYASTEPCVMCSGAIRFAGIGRVVYGVTETKMSALMGFEPAKDPLTIKEMLARTAPQIQVLGPLLEAEGLEFHIRHWSAHPFPHPR